MIYVYQLWDFHNGSWTLGSPEERERIDNSDDLYWMDEETYKRVITNVPLSGNLAEY